MDKLVPELYGVYGRYINKYRAFPFILDGAKIVERRLLYSLYELARSNLVKSAKIVGHTIGNYHPHGDQSTYASLVTLVSNGQAIGQGNWGSNIGVDDNPPAAYRYTEVRAAKEVLETAFEYITSVPHEAIELDKEPVFLPTKFPLCLTNNSSYCQGMGFGYRTLIPCYKKNDLLKRLHWILSGKKGKGPIIRPITDCKFLSGDSDFEQLLTSGNARINFKGKFRKDGPKSIIIESIPPSKSFATIFKKLSKEISTDKSLGWQDETKEVTKVRLSIAKPRMLKIDAVAKKLDEALTGTLTFDCNVCNTVGKVVRLSVDDMLLNVYKVYSQVVAKVTKDKIEAIDRHMAELALVKKIKPALRIQLKSNPDDVDLAIKEVAAAISESQKDVKEIFDKYTLGRIFKVKTSVEDLKTQKQSLIHRLNNLNDYIWKEKYLGKQNDL